MKKTLVCSLALLLLVTAAWSQSGTEKSVSTLEQQWLQSQQTNNVDLLAPLLADKFVNTSSDGKVTASRRRWQNTKRPNGRAPGIRMLR